MIAKFLFLGILVALPVSAADFDYHYEDEAKPEFETSVDGSVYPPKSLKKKGINPKAMARDKKSPAVLPDATTRDAAFAKVAGLEESLKGFDHMKKDILYVKARTKTLKELQKSYPSIPEPVLKSLRDQVRKQQ